MFHQKLLLEEVYDLVKVNLNKKRVDLLIDDQEIKKRFKEIKFNYPENQTPWQEISRKYTGQLEDGACLDLKEGYFSVAQSKGIPRDNH